MRQKTIAKILLIIWLILFIAVVCAGLAHASDQFLKVDGQILNRMSIVTVGKIETPCKRCICSYSKCDEWNFLVWPTSNPRAVIVITGSSKADIEAKHKLVEDWLIKGK